MPFKVAEFLKLICLFAWAKSGEGCHDQSKHCKAWSNAGYCDPSSQYHTHMTKHCKRSCKMCVDCADVGDYCSVYKSYCSDPNYRDYLIKQCKSTCNFCHIAPLPTSTSRYVTTPLYTGAGGTELQSGCGKKGPSHTRIVGGKNAKPGDWPWQVNFDYKYNTGNPGHHCGGILITKEWIISAAHCFFNDQNKDNYWFKLGEHDIKTPSKWEQNYTIKELILHPKYKNNGFHYDLALIRADGAATFNDRVKPACLPGQNTSFDIGTKCYITGWGLLKEFGHGPAILQQAKVPLVAHKKCQNAFNPLNYDVTPQMLCAGYHNGSIDACDGDSGGPLVCSKKDLTTNEDIWFVWGAISWGVGCARQGLYGVFASIKSMRPWVDSVVFKNIVK